MERFVCTTTSEPPQLSPTALVELGLNTSEQLHNSAEKIAQAARAVCDARGGRLARLPFCNTLEAEALGAKVRLEAQGAFVREPPYHSPQELPEHLVIESLRTKVMLEAVSQLHTEGLCPAYGVEGVLTVLSQLLPMNVLFRTLRKPEGQALLRKIECASLGYIERAADSGAQILSYADPVATIDIVGQKTFCACVAPSLVRLLGDVRRTCPELTVFLCGKMSQSLLDAGVAYSEPVPVPVGLSFEKALLWYANEPVEKGILGLGCLNRLKAPCRNLTRLRLKDERGGD